MGAYSTQQQAQMAPGLEWAAWTLRTTLALVRGAVRRGAGLDELLRRHPVLHDTLDAAAAEGLADLTLDEALARLDERLLAGAPDSGPLARLRHALQLDADGLGCWLAATLADADPRLAPFIDELHGQAGHPTRALLSHVFGAAIAGPAVQALASAGCWDDRQSVLTVPPHLQALACGLPPSRHGPGAWRWQSPHEAPRLTDLILPDALGQRIEALLCGAAVPRCWVLRGCVGSGRRTLAAALAREVGLGLVEAASAEGQAALGAAATLLGAMPLATFDPAPGEALAWALPGAAPPWLAVRLPRHGALHVAGRETTRIDLAPPDAAERRRHWRAARPGEEPDEELVGLRLPRGTLHRVARTLPASADDALAHVIEELQEQGRHRLEGVARAVPAAAPDEALALPDAAHEEFESLVARCRHRDGLAGMLPAAFGATPGVRALFKGPSGTGKTLAARHLAAALRRPLYRVDLAAAVSKYIGETERNLERVFEAAESLDIVLLLDEGDALLAGRTGVANATDRYANLETNYLLQRLEHYDGVLVVTTNAAERIDTAFARRMDVTIEFPLPDAHTRLDLWSAHLGDHHRVPGDLLERVALRCALSGGQVRNASLHAALLALRRGATVLDAHDLRAALEREYRKVGQQCPSFGDGD